MSRTPSPPPLTSPKRPPLSPIKPANHAEFHFQNQEVRFRRPVIAHSVEGLIANTSLGENHAPASLSSGSHYSPGAPFVKRARGRNKTAESTSNIGSPSPTRPISLSLPKPAHLKRKRSQVDDDTLDHSPSVPASTPVISLEDKISRVLLLCKQLDLPFHTFIYEVFRTPTSYEKNDWTEDDGARFRKRAAVVSHFLRGQSGHTPAEVLDLWIRHPYGRVHKASSEMFSFTTSHPYQKIRPVRPALTSFAVQVIQRELISQARDAVKPSSGLHVHIPTQKTPFKAGVPALDWRSIGVHTHDTIARIHQEYQPLLWGLLSAVASPDAYRLAGTDRERRPAEGVVTTAISKLTFSRSPHARLGPLLEGLFNIVSNVPDDKFRYDSRVGNTPSYKLVLRALYGLSQRSSLQILDICHDPSRWFWLITDNVQNYIRRRTLRLGRANHMNVGMAATVWIAPPSDVDPSVIFDYDEKERLRAACQRDHITTTKLLGFIDQEHECKVFAFQWLWVLGNYVTQLSNLKQHANMLLRTRARIQKVPDVPTEVFPLPTTSGSETKLPEYQRSIIDFLKSAGQTAEHFHKRVIILGGDGLTFELSHKVQQQRQFHDSPFHSFRVLNPTLQWWHTFWTNDSRIIDRHLVSYASLNPATLGHSASKIARKIPINQGKYDYHHATELMYFVADMRMLDCWRLQLVRVAEECGVNISPNADVFQVVEMLYSAAKLPSVARFEELAFELHEHYTTERAIFRASSGRELRTFPRIKQPEEALPSASRRSILEMLDSEPAASESHTSGDTILARSKDFMREAIRSREAVWSSAEGDVGRVWAQLKSMMPSFAGSSHKKYAQYLLETIIDLELESSPQLREAILSSGVATLSGLPGSHKPGDLLQEYFQRILEAIVQHKGAEFGERFIREGIARNLAHFQRLKEEFLGGVGLERHSQRRSKPSSNAEMRILLKEYRECELHSYQKGRHFGDETKIESHFSLGVGALQTGLLKKWTSRMMLMRDSRPSSESSHHPSRPPLRTSSNIGATVTPDNSTPISYDDDDDDNEWQPLGIESHLYVHDVENGDILMRPLDPEGDAHDIIAILEESDNGELDDTEDISTDILGQGINVDNGFDSDSDNESLWNPQVQ